MPLLGQKPVETISEYVEDDTSYKWINSVGVHRKSMCYTLDPVAY